MLIPKSILSTSGKYSISYLPKGSESFALSGLFESHNTLLYVTPGDSDMAMLAANLQFFLPTAEVLTLPAWDCLPYDRVSPSASIVQQRIETLSVLSGAAVSKSKRIVITTINALLQKLPTPEYFAERGLVLNVGATIPRESIINFLVRNGYSAVSNAAEPGEFAVRGSIIDIAPISGNMGYRLDFLDTTLESIRTYDPLTQISSGKSESLKILPASEIALDPESIAIFSERYKELFGASSMHDPLYEAVMTGRKYAGMEHWLPLFHNSLSTLLNYLPNCPILIDENVEAAKEERLALIEEHYQNRKQSRAESIESGASYKPIPPDYYYWNQDDWQKIFDARSVFLCHSGEAPQSQNVLDASIKTAPTLHLEALQNNGSAFDLLKNMLGKNHSIWIGCFSQGSKERIEHILESNDIVSRTQSYWDLNAPKHLVNLAILPLEHGWQSVSSIFFSEQDLLGERITRTPKRKRASETLLKEAGALEPGELIVHRDHGIGRFEGLELITALGTQHECLKLIYGGGDRLFLPVENIDLVSRYGGDSATAELDKLGGVSWQDRKARMKKRIKMAATELLKIAALRKIRTAPIFYANETAYEKFCSRFPYAETEDQLHTIEDVEKDLSSGAPMDRLVCGDVGFGKTEVAMRAAFLATQPDQDGVRGQVAIIAPTTLLCRQHYHTFTERFQGFPVQIRQLSRLVTGAEASRTRRALAEGNVDIIIGTHALLSNQTKFKNLALMIVDEEQHFGVKQKEKLKTFRAETHVLTLSATPIPRTLQMSLTGARDLSLITTPPVDRLAVRTFVMPYDPMILREAMLRERARGGRVFYVAPRISDLDDLKKKITSLVPEISIAVAHGQMDPDDLDHIMNDFYDGKYELLLSTSIIESGIDIPSANTMIIHRADMFGLAQLYQLRGRVGRAKVRAYAYLTLPAARTLSDTATKRLEVMKTLDTLGAGFTLASHDMDIRGFGNLLGEEQSGNIKEVGIELFQQMLEEAIAEVQAEERGTAALDMPFSPQINIGTSVMIPESYVADLSLRLSLYKRIASLKTLADIESVAAEMIDRFGSLPVEVVHLFETVKIKQICVACGIDKLEVGPKGATLRFYKNQCKYPDALLKLLHSKPALYRLRPDNIIVVHNRAWEKVESRFKELPQVLSDFTALAA